MNKQTISWISGDGKKIEFIIKTSYELTMQGTEKKDGLKKLEIIASINGETQSGFLRKIKHPQCVARFGNIGVVEKNMDRINAAINIIYLYINKYNSKFDEHFAKMEKIDVEQEQIRKAMDSE
jgi:hypothetical protein